MVSLAPPFDDAGRAAPQTAWAQSPAVCLAGLLTFAVVLFAPAVLNDGDSYWHLAAGEWMLAHREVLKTDVFSYTFAGRPWHTHEWLAEVLTALAWRLAGWSGVVILHGLAAGAAMGLVAHRLGRRLSWVGLTLALTLVFACAAPSLLVRPHLLATPLLAGWVTALLAARDAGRAPPLGLALLMTLWANLHGGYVLGLALIAPFALEAVMAAGDRRASALRDWSLFAAASLIAALITPFGLAGLTYPIELMAMHSLPAIAEWRPADFSHVGPLEIALFVTLYALLGRGVRLPPIRLVLLLGLLHMALQHSRHQIVLALVGALLLADLLGETAPGALGSKAQRLATLACAATALLLAAVRVATPIVRVDGPTSPISALAHVPASVQAQPVFNAYGFGGYLISRGVRPGIDGRGDMYGDAFLAAHVQAERGDRRALAAALARWSIAWTLLSPGDPAVAVMDETPGWRRLYADHYAVVHVREAARQGASESSIHTGA